MKYIIDPDEGTCVPYEPVQSTEVQEPIGIADSFRRHDGAREYEGIVATIQRWYYGTLVKAPWCCTALCYFLNCLGRLSAIGGKNENVKLMADACLKASKQGCGTYFPKESIPKYLKEDDILFFLWDSGSVMTVNSSKHVCVCAEDCDDDTVIRCIGGNQSDCICETVYPKSKLYAVYRINK